MSPVAEVYRQTADLSKDVERLRSLATDIVDEGVHAAKRTMKSVSRGIEQLSDIKDEAVHGVKRHPVKAVGLALGVGLVLGIAVGWSVRRPVGAR